MTETTIPVDDRRDVDPNTLGVAIALGGVVLSIVAAWLRLLDPDSYRRAHPGEPVDDQLLGQTTLGLLIVGVGVACAASLALAFRGQRTTWGPMIAGAAVIVLAIVAGLRYGVLVGHFGAAHGTPGPGLGVYGGLVAGLLMLVGGLLILRLPSVQTLGAACAAGVLVAASAWWLAGLSERAPVAGGAVTMDGSAWLTYPNDGTNAKERRSVGYDTCATQSVESLARLLNALHADDFTGGPVHPRTNANAEAVARGYARYFGDQVELYEGCMEGFRSQK